MSNHNNGYDFEPTNNSTFSLNLADNNVLEDFSGNYVDVDGGNPSMPEPESRMDVLGALDGFANQVHVARSRGISDFYQWNARNNSSAAQNNATTNGLRSAPDMTSDNTGLPSFNYGGRFNANGPFLFNRGHAGSDSMQRIPAQGVHRRIAPSNTQNTSTIKNQLARMNTQMEARVTHIADMQIQMADMHTRMTGVQTQLDGLRTQMAGLAGVAALPNAPNPAAQPMAAAQGSANTVIKNASATAGDTDDQGNAEAEGSRVPSASASASTRRKKKKSSNFPFGSIAITVYQLSGADGNVDWKRKLERKIKLPQSSSTSSIVSIADGLIKTRVFGGDSASFKIKYKAEDLDQSGQFRVLSVNELGFWQGQVRMHHDWVVKVFVYRADEEDYAGDDMLP